MLDARIVAALINCFRPLIHSDKDFEPDLAERLNTMMQLPNKLEPLLNQYSKNQINSKFEILPIDENQSSGKGISSYWISTNRYEYHYEYHS